MIMLYTPALTVVLSTSAVAEEKADAAGAAICLKISTEEPEVTQYEYTQGILLE